MDPLKAVSLLAQGLPLSFLPDSIPSPVRMMFINPRRYFTPGEDVDWMDLVSKVASSALVEWLANITIAGLPVSGYGILGRDALTSSAATIAAKAATDEIMGSDGSLYIFYINPQNVSVAHQKITQETLTGAGWDFDVLGDQLSSYNFSGTSGNMLTTIPFTSWNAIRLSRAFLKFVLFEQFYLYNNNDPLIMLFDRIAYVGKLTSMNYTWNADDIYQIKYDFSWRCDPIYSFEPLTGVGITPLFDRTDILQTMFDSTIQSNLFLNRAGKIDTYETGIKLYPSKE